MVTLAVLAVRVVPVLPAVRGPDGSVRFLDGDSYFHLRQIESILDDFPHFARTDSHERYPTPVRGDGAGLFDLGVAAAVRALAGPSPDRHQLLRIAPWISPLLAALSVLLLAAIARRWMDPWPAAWCAAAYAMWPGTAQTISLFGYVDHHATEIVLLQLTLLGVSHLLAVREEASLPRLAAIGALAALPLASFLFAWIGAGLHVAALGISLFPVLILEIARGNSPAPTARALAIFATWALIGATLVTFITPELVINPTSFRIALLGLVALGSYPALLALLARALAARGWPPGRTALGVTGLTVLGLAAALAGSPGGRHLVVQLLSKKSLLVLENVAVTPEIFFTEHGPVAFLALLALPVAFRRKDALLPWVLGFLWVALWVRTADYGYLAGPLLAGMSGFAVQGLLEVAPAGSGHRRIGLGGLALVLVLPFLGDGFRKPWPRASLVRNLVIADPGWDEAMSWLSRETPPPGSIGPGDLPGYGVASYWDVGNLISFLGERPAVWSRFPTTEDARWVLEPDERWHLRLYREKCREGGKIRYVVVNGRTVAESFMTAVAFKGEDPASFVVDGGSLVHDGKEYAPASYGRRHRDAVIVRLYQDAGQGLSHHRLVFETTHAVSQFYRWKGTSMMRVTEPLRVDGTEPPSDSSHITVSSEGALEYGHSMYPAIRIFEVVPGARCRGRALPGTELTLQLDLEVEGSGRRFEYVNRTPVTSEGTYEIRIPYPTSGRPEASRVRSRGPYRVQVVGLGGVTLETGTLEVPEEKVQSGDEVTPRMGPAR